MESILVSDNRLALGATFGVAQYLAELYPSGLPDGHALTVTRLPGGSSWHYLSIEAAVRAWPELEVGQRRGKQSLHLACGTRPTGLTQRQRGGNDDVRAIPGLWADIDTRDGIHAAGESLPTTPTALSYLAALTLPPSLVLHSGGGLYAWWHFNELLILDSESERTAAGDLLKGLHNYLRSNAPWGGSGIECGQLHSLLRPAGALNYKYDPPRRVSRLNDASTGARYNPGEFEEWVVRVQPAPGPQATPHQAIEFPRELPPHLKKAMQLAGTGVAFEIRHQEYGGLKAVKLTLCPICQGSEKDGGIEHGSAWINVLSGKLLCHRQTCDAREPSGLRFGKWVARLLDSAALDEVFEEQLQTFASPIPLFPPGTQRVTLDEFSSASRELAQVAIAWAAENNGIGILAATPGAGKTALFLDLARGNPHFVFLLPTHELIREKMAEFGGPAHHFKGVAEACLQPGVKKQAKTLGTLGVRHVVCPHCPLIDQCEAWTDVPRDRPIFATHVAAEELNREKMIYRGELKKDGTPKTSRLPPVLEDRTVIYDELPQHLYEVRRISQTTILHANSLIPQCLRLSIRFGKVRRSEFEGPIAFALEAIGRIMEQAKLAWVSAPFKVAEGKDLAALAHTEGLEIATTIEYLKKAATYGREVFRRPFDGKKKISLNLANFDPADYVADEIAELFAPLADALSGKPSGIRLTSDDEGELSFGVLKLNPFQLANTGAILLDGTAHILMPWIEAVNRGRPVHFFGLDVVGTASKEQLLFIGDRGTSRKALLKCRKLTTRGWGKVVSTLRRAYDRARSNLGRRDIQVGIITFKDVATELIAAFGDPQSAFGAELGKIEGLSLAPEHVGWFGRHDRGSNAMENLDLLLVFGTPRRNHGDTAFAARALGLPDDERHMLNRWAMMQLEQAQARLRLLRRAAAGSKATVVVAAQFTPPGWSASASEIVQPKIGRPVDPRRSPLAEVCSRLVKEYGILSPMMLGGSAEITPIHEMSSISVISADPPSERRCREVVAAVARTRGLTQVKVKLPCKKIYIKPGKPEEDAMALAKAFWNLRESPRLLKVARQSGDRHAQWSALDLGLHSRWLLRVQLRVSPPSLRFTASERLEALAATTSKVSLQLERLASLPTPGADLISRVRHQFAGPGSPEAEHGGA